MALTMARVLPGSGAWLRCGAARGLRRTLIWCGAVAKPEVEGLRAQVRAAWGALHACTLHAAHMLLQVPAARDLGVCMARAE
jgi:hypothetical protein